MRADTTYVWGVAADTAGMVHHEKVWQEEIRSGGVRIKKWVLDEHEPATAYGTSHPAPMPMKWSHNDEIGRIVALRRAHGRLLAVGETEELEPDDLAGLTEKFGDLRFSTSTDNRRNEPLRIDEISLTPKPATVGLPAVKWYKFGVSKGNMPMWVREELQRADKMEFRQRRELQINDLDYERNPYSDLERFQRDVGLHPSVAETGRDITLNGERVPLESRPARILSVGGRPVGGK